MVASNKMKNFLYKWLPIVFGCHCRDDRSFHYKGEKFPICARCTGELVGIIFSIFSCFFFKISILAIVILMLPLILDGGIQMFTSYESNNFKRFVTGLLIECLEDFANKPSDLSSSLQNSGAL